MAIEREDTGSAQLRLQRQQARSRMIAWSLFGFVALFFIASLAKMGVLKAVHMAVLPWGGVVVLLGMTLTLPMRGAVVAYAFMATLVLIDVVTGPSMIIKGVELAVLALVGAQLYAQWRSSRRPPA